MFFVTNPNDLISIFSRRKPSMIKTLGNNFMHLTNKVLCEDKYSVIIWIFIDKIVGIFNISYFGFEFVKSCQIVWLINDLLDLIFC